MSRDVWPIQHLDKKSTSVAFLSYVQWSPRDNSLIIVQDGNIFYTPGIRSPHVYQLTKSGVPRVISNGVPDWLYEGN